ncbi:MAG: trigger factor [Burkholderiales bacterium]|nr:trigger factor [Burkholderiales bacterium]
MQQQASPQTASPLERSLDLSFPLQQIESEIESRLKRIARTAKLPGFRPGKVPLKLVAQQYGGQVRQEVIGDSVQKNFSEMIRQQNLRVAGYPRFQAKQPADAADNLQFTATFEVYPDIAISELSSVVIQRIATEITDADIDRTIEILRKQRIHYHAVDRGAQQGDQVRLDFDGKLDGFPFEGGQGKDQTLVVGENRFLPDFEANVVAMKAGEAKSFELTFPADYHGKDMAGKTVIFEIKVNEVAEAHLPEFDADFAKSLGIEDGDIGKMRGEIRLNLEREAKKRIQAKHKDQVMQALIDHATLTVPKSLVEMEIQRLAENALKDFQSRGMAIKDTQLPKELFQAQAERRVRLGLILAEVVKQNGLQAKPEQVKAVIEEHAQSYEAPAEMVRWYYQQPERLSEVEAVVLEDNVVAWGVSKAKTEDVAIPFQELMENSK